MAVDWTQLPPDILESISKNLTIYIDYLRFRAVCHTWRISLPTIPHHLPPQLPWLMLPLSQSMSQSLSNQTHRSFFDPSVNKVHHLNLPEASHRKRCCGSSHGWLVILHETPTILLQNPLTRAKLYLPPLTTFPNVVSFNSSHIGNEYSLGHEAFPGRTYRHSAKHMRDCFIRKVVLSSSPTKDKSFIALAILHNPHELAFCKNGDPGWTFIHNATCFNEDVIYHNELFYAVNTQGVIAVYDLHGENSPKVSIIETRKQFGGDMQYLVISGDELLLVKRYFNLILNHEPHYKTVWFEVFRMNRSERPEWERVRSLGDRMLFVGGISSLSLSSSDFRGCSGNCIYYGGGFQYHDLGIFKLWDGSIEPLPSYHPSSLPHLCWTPIWVTPNP
ncbi:F-box protein SKIP23-like [Fagus crenata]